MDEDLPSAEAILPQGATYGATAPTRCKEADQASSKCWEKGTIQKTCPKPPWPGGELDVFHFFFGRENSWRASVQMFRNKSLRLLCTLIVFALIRRGCFASGCQISEE